MNILIVLIVCYVIFVGGILTGEWYASKNPDAKFTKFWRRHVVGIIPPDDEFF